MSPTIHPLTPRVVVACGCTLAEEVIWDARSDSLIWVDIENPAVWRHWPAIDETRRVALDEKISFALLTTDPDVVVAGLKSGVVLLDLADGARWPLVKPAPHPPGNRLNSGNIGPDGALWFGTMDDAEESDTGSFHRWDGETLTNFGGKAAVTNGPVVSPDGTRLYTIDTARGLIRVHDLDGNRIGEPRTLITFDPSWGHPDGLTLDADAHLWVCHYGGSRITRFAPDGTIERIVPVPTALVTKCAFGGPDLSTLYITTCLRGRDPTIDPMAGHLFAVETEFRGFPGNIFGATRRVAA
ncbi:SMP-30/gluconolactonase/LRE family protein [Methylobacterium haplocladii]|uniref:Calcium-binding protein n=1 Tax=Methylobacterium haplocladii TaxID=1176176 RepID=A0A512IJV7_9HYPH|nr:SMP-30/gluconolactonase/LRE family protein [Methylobacterium haplocladii]GEO97964.1 calcium-binding protein [Methylobacterium haplocladii]GJD86016.1 L-arabinolactonase [Methylobacterium haplocladii]GLS57865.1 calcium-binding protein [Methylobacterium haplocladii]